MVGALIRIVFVIFSLFLHEWAHVFIARGYGAKIEQVRLSVFGMFARVRRMDNLRPRQRLAVYFAGPMVNIMIAAWAYTVHHLSYIGVFWLRDLAFYNGIIAGYNLLPLLPLDGGRIAQHFLGNGFGILRANRFLLRVGRIAAIGIAVLGLVQIILFSYNITLLLAAIFIWRKNTTLQALLRMECFLTLQKKPALLRGIRGRDKYRVKSRAVPADMPIKRAVEKLGWSYIREFVIDGIPVREEKLMAFIFSTEQPSITDALNMPIRVLL
jgi:stage IV sporulation protein FB